MEPRRWDGDCVVRSRTVTVTVVGVLRVDTGVSGGQGRGRGRGSDSGILTRIINFRAKREKHL